MEIGNSNKGQSLVEMALMVPLLFLLVVNVVNFGGYLYAWISVVHASRAAVQYAITGPAYLGYGSSNGLATAPPANPGTVATADMVSLPTTTTPIVTVCTSTPTKTCALADPEAGTSEITTVDVTYRYCPFIPAWDFPNMGIHLTLPPCTTSGGVTTGGVTVHRTAAMRMIQ